MADYGTDYFHLGIVVSVFSYAFGLGSLPAGYLADRVGPRRLVTIYLFGSGIAAMLVGGFVLVGARLRRRQADQQLLVTHALDTDHRGVLLVNTAGRVLNTPTDGLSLRGPSSP